VSEVSSISAWDLIEALLADDTIFDMGATIPDPPRHKGGRPRKYPTWAIFFFGALRLKYQSARQVEAELRHPLVWEPLCELVRERFPDQPEMWLPAQPMKAYHWAYGRAQAESVAAAIGDVLEHTAATKATEMGLCAGQGSWTNPHRNDLIEIDGKIIEAACRGSAQENAERISRGDPPLKRFDPDASSQKQGDNTYVVGNKFVIASTRGDTVHSRLILSVVADVNHREVDHAMAIADRLVGLLPGVAGVVYDAALRGVHIQHLMRDLGILGIAPVVSQSGRRGSADRVLKRVAVDHQVAVKGGMRSAVDVYAEGGAAGIDGQPHADGTRPFVLLELQQVKRVANTDRTFRWYGIYAIPASEGGGTVNLGLVATAGDTARRLNRTENLRAFPPGSQQYEKLYGRRSDAESTNRQIDDGLYLHRANSFGSTRNLVDLYCHAAAVNAIAIARYRASSRPPALAA